MHIIKLLQNGKFDGFKGKIFKRFSHLPNLFRLFFRYRDRLFFDLLVDVSLFLMLRNKFNQKARVNLALLLLLVRLVVFRAKANVPNKRSRYIDWL